MTRVLVNMPSQFGGKHSGVARVALNLLERLIENPAFTYVLRSPWTREQLPEPLRRSAMEVMTMNRPRIMVLDVAWQALSMPFLCRRMRIDLVLNVDAYGAATGGRARVMIVHDLYFRTIPEQTGRREALTSDLIFRLMVRGNAAAICVSDATRRELVASYPRARPIATIIHSAATIGTDPHGTDPSEVTGRYVLAVGNATHNKNFAILAQAMTLVQTAHPDLAIVHVGEDPDETIAATLRRLGVKVRLVRLTGLDDTRLAALYRGAACLCVPSLAEGFCLPILEAQALGCPVICSDRSAMPEIAGDGALLFDPTDAGALASQLKRIVGDHEIRDDLVRRGLANAGLFSWDRAARAYEAVMLGALQGRSAR